MNSLPTLLNLGRRGVNNDALCPLCRKEPESTIHALFFFEKIWELWWYWQTCPIGLLAEKHDLIDMAMHILEVGISHDLEVLFTTAWSIWYNRN